MDAFSLLIDLKYAIRQLREHKCIDRALDALDRLEMALESEGAPNWDGVGDIDGCCRENSDQCSCARCRTIRLAG